MVEHRFRKAGVVGPNPTGGSNRKCRIPKGMRLFFFDQRRTRETHFDRPLTADRSTERPGDQPDDLFLVVRQDVGVLKEGGVIVVEGVSFKDEKGLGETLVKLASGGLSVLILAPSAGEVAIPGIGGPAGGLEELTFRRDIVRTLDKRLDSDGWPPDGKAAKAPGSASRVKG